jgi:TetR/AcrR family transcriptional regulator
LLAAALDLFVEKGYAATRVEEVAQRAGVSKGTLFLYFATKEALFTAVVHENLGKQVAHWDAAIDQFEGSSAALVHASLLGWWHRVGSTKASGITRLVHSEAQNFPEIAAYYQEHFSRPGLALMRRILARGISRGEFRPIDPTAGAYALLGIIIFMAMWKHTRALFLEPGAVLDPEAHIAQQVDIVLNGFAKQAPSQGISA